MTDLKTLQDLGSGLDSTEITENIRQEAIQWLKRHNWHLCPDGKAVFMEFFNLTEDDLK